MKKIKLMSLVFSILLIYSCNNSTQNSEAPYRGEPMLNYYINLTYPDSIGYNDTISIITTLPIQRYRMKGYLAFYIEGLDSTITLISPNSLRGLYPNDTSSRYDFFLRIPVNFYPNQALTQEWKFIFDTTKVVNSYLKNYRVQFSAHIAVDSIYLDMDTLYYPAPLSEVRAPRAVPEKKWYDCDFSQNRS